MGFFRDECFSFPGAFLPRRSGGRHRFIFDMAWRMGNFKNGLPLKNVAKRDGPFYILADVYFVGRDEF